MVCDSVSHAGLKEDFPSEKSRFATNYQESPELGFGGRTHAGYMALCRIDEEPEQVVTVARVVHGKSDIASRLRGPERLG